MRKLRPDVVKTERRNETDHGVRNAGGGDHHVVVLGDAGVAGQAISPWANLLQSAGPRHPRECASVDSLMSYIPSTQNGLLLSEAENLASGGASTLWLFAYTH